MRLALTFAFVLALAGAAYLASPFYAAYTLDHAVRTSDTATLSRKIDWMGVRKSLRGSIARYADLTPMVRTATQRVRPTIWQRIKSAFGYSMLDRFIDAYVTPEGLPKLRRMREAQIRRAMVSRRREPRIARARTVGPAALPLPERSRDGRMSLGAARASTAAAAKPQWLTATVALLRRIRRAEFLSLTELELVIRDRVQKDRYFVTNLELRGFEWILTSVRVMKLRPRAHENPAQI